MKSIALTAIFLLTSMSIHAQVILVTKKDSSQLETKLRGYSKTSIEVIDREIPLGEILSIGFTQYSESRASTYSTLRDAGVKLYFDYKEGSYKKSTPKPAAVPVIVPAPDPSPGQPATTPAPVVSPIVQPQQEVTTEQIVLALDAFREQRQTGKTLQVIGFATLAVSSALLIANTNSSSPQEMSVAIPAIGAGLFVVGFGIDVAAGKHLRLRVKQ
jgi:hypothetical protein